MAFGSHNIWIISGCSCCCCILLVLLILIMVLSSYRRVDPLNIALQLDTYTNTIN